MFDSGVESRRVLPLFVEWRERIGGDRGVSLCRVEVWCFERMPTWCMF